MGQVIIMVGVPGSGKSTYVKNSNPNAPILSADNFFMKRGVYQFDRNYLGTAHASCYNGFLALIEAKQEVIVIDNTNTTLREIEKYANPAKEADYEVKIVVLKCDCLTAFNRNVHNVPLASIQKMAERIENTCKTLMDGKYECEIEIKE